MRADDRQHPLGARAGWEEAKLGAVAVHQVEEGAVFNRVIAICRSGTLVENLIGAGRMANGVGGAGQPDETRVEGGDISSKMLRRIAVGIERDEERLDRFGLVAE